MDDKEQAPVKKLLRTARERVAHRTFVQDIRESGTGRIDGARIAAKLNNLEHAVDELAQAVEHLVEQAS
jgi:hypothetical protein